jgi:hypothetical protein
MIPLSEAIARKAESKIGVRESGGPNKGAALKDFFEADSYDPNVAQDRSTWTLKPAGRDIERGDIIVFNFSHVGIAAGAPDVNGNFSTVEGNTNQAGSREGDGVYRKIRNVSSVRSRIRFR